MRPGLYYMPIVHQNRTVMYGYMDIGIIAITGFLMAELYRLWYCSAMSYYDEIYELAVDNHYLVSTDQAREAGVPPVELAKLAQRGKLTNISRGLYRLSRYVPDKNDPYAVAVARLGDSAYLYGESVIALLGLAPTNPSYIYVATPKRTRRNLPENIRVKNAAADDVLTTYEGIACQDVATAIRAASATMMGERLHEAARNAVREGYLLKADFESLRMEMGWDE